MAIEQKVTTAAVEAPDFDGIPEQLRALPRWCLWRTEDRKGKTTKVPCRLDGRRASSTKPATWASFEAAKAAYLAGGADGLGFMFDGSDLAGIDIDGCRDPATGELDEQAKGIVGRLQTYGEISVSGRGVHLILEGAVPPGGNRKGRVEMYSAGRYFCMTGRPLDGKALPVADRQVQLEELHAEIFGPPAAAEAPAAGGGEPARPGPIAPGGLPRKKLDAMLSNNRDFKRTWERRRPDFPSQSEYDESLASFAANAGCTDREIAALILEHRRRHGQDLAKAQRADYLETTIRKVRDRAGAHPDPLATLRDKLGLDIAAVHQVGATDSTFDLVLDDGRRISLGTTEQVRVGSHPQARLTEFRHVLVDHGRKAWRPLAAAIVEAAQPVEAGSETEDLADWLRAYAVASAPAADLDLSDPESLQGDAPFFAGGRLHLRQADFANFVALRCAAKLSRQELRRGLARLGFEPKQIGARRGAVVTKGRFWRGPEGYQP